MQVRITCVLFLLLGLMPPIARAEKRVALVIGNSAYKYTGELPNPRNDATDMSVALKALGFDVVEGLDLDKLAFDRKLRDFAEALSDAKVCVFFYAGHGLQVAGQNYLVPIDAKLSTAAALDWEMVRLDLVQRTMERETETNVVFLDACRDNPLARNLARTMGTRSAEIGRGLAATEAGVGTLVSFSTQPGNVALDGAGRNSPFAAALVRRILASSDDLSALLIDVRNEVRKETQNKQVPWEHSALTGRFYFNPSAQRASTTVAAPARLSEAAEAWDRAKDTTDAAVLEAFIARFKDTFYANLARARFEELRKRRVAAATPDPSPMQSTKDLYDGSWLARAVSNCRNLPTWANRFTITGSKIQGETYNRKISGRVAADGSFRYTVPGFGSPNIFGTFTGKLHDDAGTGTLKYPNCTGSITLSRM